MSTLGIQGEAGRLCPGPEDFVVRPEYGTVDAVTPVLMISVIAAVGVVLAVAVPRLQEGAHILTPAGRRLVRRVTHAMADRTRAVLHLPPAVRGRDASEHRPSTRGRRVPPVPPAAYPSSAPPGGWTGPTTTAQPADSWSPEGHGALLDPYVDPGADPSSSPRPYPGTADPRDAQGYPSGDGHLSDQGRRPPTRTDGGGGQPYLAPGQTPGYPQFEYPAAEPAGPGRVSSPEPYPGTGYPRAEYSSAEYRQPDYRPPEYSPAEYRPAEYPPAEYRPAEYPSAGHPGSEYSGYADRSATEHRGPDRSAPGAQGSLPPGGAEQRRWDAADGSLPATGGRAWDEPFPFEPEGPRTASGAVDFERTVRRDQWGSAYSSAPGQPDERRPDTVGETTRPRREADRTPVAGGLAPGPGGTGRSDDPWSVSVAEAAQRPWQVDAPSLPEFTAPERTPGPYGGHDPGGQRRLETGGVAYPYARPSGGGPDVVDLRRSAPPVEDRGATVDEVADRFDPQVERTRPRHGTP